MIANAWACNDVNGIGCSRGTRTFSEPCFRNQGDLRMGRVRQPPLVINKFNFKEGVVGRHFEVTPKIEARFSNDPNTAMNALKSTAPLSNDFSSLPEKINILKA